MHERFTPLMSLHLDAVATPTEQLELARHLRTCPVCNATWEEWQSIDRWLAITPAVAPSCDLVTEVSLRLPRQAPPGSELPWLPLGLFVLGVLALVTRCLVIACLLWGGLRHPVGVIAAFSYLVGVVLH